MIIKKGKITPAVFLELAKVKITVAVSITTVAGYLLASGRFTYQLIGVVAGIFFWPVGHRLSIIFRIAGLTSGWDVRKIDRCLQGGFLLFRPGFMRYS